MTETLHFDPAQTEYKGLKYQVHSMAVNDAFTAGFTVPKQGQMKGEIRVRLREKFESGDMALRGAHLAAKIDIERIVRG